MIVFWDVAPCILVENDQHFKSVYCLHHQGAECLPTEDFYVMLQVLTAANMNMTVFWDVAPCCLVEIDRSFRGAYCLTHLNDNGGSKNL
jgi:hypothetical protein